MFRKILIANRGEIAVRIIRACRELGIRTVAVYSEADKAALHVQLADEAIPIGPPPPLESYLKIEALIEAAKASGTEAIHPGYGFLAENPIFARRCQKAGLVFIGPQPQVIEALGNKITARTIAEKAGVPVIPGATLPRGEVPDYLKVAETIGYPLLVKAAAGGGGKGMRVVRKPSELPDLLASASREAEAAFGDATVFLEKYLDRPRHVEFQILGDEKGCVVHLGERECSIQRRHQKLLEETPSPALDEALRRRMGEAALAFAEAAGYTNAGTVEFLLDEGRNFYFLEVNTRLQVEHSITELCTGVDLVKEQIRVAAGDSLRFGQDHIQPRGYAIECRIYAEDPANRFLPATGKVLALEEPSGPGIRADSGLYLGCEISPYYDPLLSKLSVWAEDREAARRRMVEALRAYTILGVTTCREFLIDLLEHPEFIAGRTYTHFILDYFADWKGEGGKHREAALIVAAVDACRKARLEPGRPEKPTAQASSSPWKTLGRWRLGG